MRKVVSILISCLLVVFRNSDRSKTRKAQHFRNLHTMEGNK